MVTVEAKIFVEIGRGHVVNGHFVYWENQVSWMPLFPEIKLRAELKE